MAFFTRSKTPKCESDFEAAYQRAQQAVSHQISLPKGADAVFMWMSANRKVERCLDAILQRQVRLERLKIESEAERDNLRKAPLQRDSESTESKDKNLKALRKLYGFYQVMLDQLAEPERVSAIVQERILLRQSRDRYGRTYAWLYSRGKCADVGGCCGRTCGCCEKPLRTYLRPKLEGATDTGIEVIEVLSHCSGECACCIRHQGFYQPEDLSVTPILEDLGYGADGQRAAEPQTSNVRWLTR